MGHPGNEVPDSPGNWRVKLMRYFFLMSLVALIDQGQTGDRQTPGPKSCNTKGHQNISKVTKLLFPAARATFLLKQCANTHGRKKSTSSRSHSHFQPPLKNVIFTVGVKSIAKICFPCCMRSIKKVLLTEHGKHIFDFCNPSAAKRPLFIGHNHRRGVSKIANRDSHAA